MVRRYLQCDICGDKWDITNTEYADMVADWRIRKNMEKITEDLKNVN